MKPCAAVSGYRGISGMSSLVRSASVVMPYVSRTVTPEGRARRR
jgi:hypothetical protein